jgi:hypothetical protein
MDLQLSKINKKTILDGGKTASIIYHDIFDFPLTSTELIKWEVDDSFSSSTEMAVENKKGFYFLRGKDGVILKRLMRKRASKRKLYLARKYGKIIGLIPQVKMVAVTGALAMQNADAQADIDLMIITSEGTLWTSRLLTFLLLNLFGIGVRRFGKREQKDKLCLNIWLDGTALVWPKKDRNIYTAHEISQIIPLINKANTYENFIASNVWIKNYWPNATRTYHAEKPKASLSLVRIIEPFTRKFQYHYMKQKITREVILSNKALFHPHDWGEVVKVRLISQGFARTS